MHSLEQTIETLGILQDIASPCKHSPTWNSNNVRSTPWDGPWFHSTRFAHLKQSLLDDALLCFAWCLHSRNGGPSGPLEMIKCRQDTILTKGERLTKGESISLSPFVCSYRKINMIKCRQDRSEDSVGDQERPPENH